MEKGGIHPVGQTRSGTVPALFFVKCLIPLGELLKLMPVLRRFLEDFQWRYGVIAMSLAATKMNS